MSGVAERQLALRDHPGFVMAVHRYIAGATRTDDGCLLRKMKRYGDVYWEGKARRLSAHRAIHILFHGPIPEGLVVRHKCDRKNCVEPAHLEVGTQSQNLRDMRRTGANTYTRNRGRANASAILTEELVITLRREARRGQAIRDIATSHGLSYSATRNAIKGVSWGWVTDEPPLPPNYKWSTPSPSRTPSEVRARALELADKGMSLAEIAAELGVARDTAYQLTRASAA